MCGRRPATCHDLHVAFPRTLLTEDAHVERVQPAISDPLPDEPDRHEERA